MRQYRTAQGKQLDMAGLIAKNERVRAVGNMRVNARGDTIDANGKVIVPVTQKVGEKYQNTVGNRSAQPVKTAKAAPKQQLTKDELDVEASLDDDLEIEKIKAQESKK